MKEIKEKILFDNFVIQVPQMDKEQQFSNTQNLNKSTDYCLIRDSLRSARASSNEKIMNRLKHVNKKNPYFNMNKSIIEQNLNST